MFGALAGVLPKRLGGSTSENGWTATQHARVVADLLAVNRTLPLAKFTVTKSGTSVTISDYVGRNGVGAAYAPDIAEGPSTGVAKLWWSPSLFPDIYNDHRSLPFAIHSVIVTMAGATGGKGTWEVEGTPARLAIRMFPLGVLGDGTVSVTVYGTLDRSDRRELGDYAGDPDKADSKTEGKAPYAEFFLREFRAQRGAAYSQKPASLVDAENLALARFWAAVGPRNAEKFRANMLPGTSDERLPYWEKLLAIPLKQDDPKWVRRRKLASHYRGSEGASQEEVRRALQDLLGGVFVDMSWDQGASLSAPPEPTKWPGVDPGNPADSLGGGAWLSTRNHLFVQVQVPSTMTTGEFLTLMNVEFKALTDRLLAGWATCSWATSDGFLVDISQVDFDGV